MSTSKYEDILCRFDEQRHDFSAFMNHIVDYIGRHPGLTKAGAEVVHSYKSRLKDREHLRDKLKRKEEEGRAITVDNVFDEITDLAGVRIMHIFQAHFSDVDKVIRARVAGGDWVLSERPKAYTWDPEAAEFFGAFDLDVVQKPTSYTSVHYLIRPRADSPICCELQVRTLFEEIWGEVDHKINYPKPTESVSCKEQIKVLSKIVGAGSRLLDSLYKVQAHEAATSTEKDA